MVYNIGMPRKRQDMNVGSLQILATKDKDGKYQLGHRVVLKFPNPKNLESYIKEGKKSRSTS